MNGETVRGANSYRVIGVLFVIWVIAYLDRQIITLLVGSMKNDLSLSDTQISLLQGMAFSAVFAVAGLPLGWLADRTNRRNLIIFGILLWSTMTIGCGLCTTFPQLLLARMGVGIGEACLAPASLSLISDYFTAERRGRAVGLMMAGASVGTALSVFMGGALVTLLSDTGGMKLWLFGWRTVWQAAFILVGLPGVAGALLLLTIAEPSRFHAPASRQIQDRSGLPQNYFKTRWRLFLPLYLGFACNLTIAYGSAVWLPVSLIRIHQVRPIDVGLLAGILSLTIGPMASVAGGVLGDHFARSRPMDGRLILSIGVLVPVLALAALSLPASAAWPSMLALASTMVVANLLSATSYAILSDVVPNRLKGQSIALYLLVGNLAGQGLGPTAIALSTDRLFKNEFDLPYSITLVLGAAAVIAIALLLLSVPQYRSERAQRIKEQTKQT